MTISVTTNKVKFDGDGATTEFDFTFKVFQASDIKLILITKSDGTEVDLALTTNYSVAINSTSEGGTITTVSTYASTHEILIKRVLPKTQVNAFPTESNIPEKIIENSLDKSIMIAQEQDEKFTRVPVLPEGTDLENLEFPVPVAGKALVWNSTATALVNSTDDLGEAATAQAAAETAQTAAELAETNAEASETAAAASAVAAAVLTGSMDIVHQDRFTSILVSDYTTGNAATPDNAGSGTKDGSFVNNTASPFYGTNNPQYVNSASGQNDFALITTAIALPSWAIGRDVKFTQFYRYTGSNNDLVLLVHDATNDTVISAANDYFLLKGTPVGRITTTISIPSNCTAIKHGFQTKVSNNFKILTLGPIEISTDV